MLDDKPIAVRKLDRYRVAFDLPQAYSVADRLFDGIFILPRHKLEAAYKQGKLEQAWPLTAPPAEIAGLGPFRFKEYVAGERITLERNPYYWKVDQAGTQLPYLDEVTFLSRARKTTRCCASRPARATSSTAWERAISRPWRRAGSAREYDLVNVGASMEYSFLFFNLAEPSAGCARAQLAAHLAVLRRDQIPPGRLRGDRPRFDGAHGLPGARGAAGGAGTAGKPVLDQRTGCRRRCGIWNTRGNCWHRTASSGIARARCSIPRACRWSFPS